MDRTWTFRKPSLKDVAYVAAHMRSEDRREVTLWSGQHYDWALGFSVKTSDFCRTAVAGDGAVLGIFGATRTNLVDGEAQVWFLSTEDVWTHKAEFLRTSRDALDLMGREMPDVAAFHEWVYADYRGAVEWVGRWLGGEWEDGLWRGAAGGRFRKAVFRNEHHKEG